jgi:aryl-alcohol dehydrogenase-like predicted oxidoreductase
LPESKPPLIRQAVDVGINFFDTANAYSDGTSEEIVGRASRTSRARRVVIATKVFFPMHKGPNGGGLSRKAIFYGNRRQPAAARHGLRRSLPDPSLGLHNANRGDARGAARCREGGQGTLYRRLLHVCVAIRRPCTSRAARLDAFVSMQNHYNLLYREEEREMMPLCTDERIAVVPWSPLARGRLTRPWDTEATARSRTDEYGNKLYESTSEADRKVVEQVATIAAARGVPKAQVALAWVAQKPFVTAPIIGASKPQQLDDAVAALTLQLGPAEIAQLEAPYVPHTVVGHQ